MDIHFIRNNFEYVKQNQKNRFLQVDKINDILDNDNKWKLCLKREEIYRALKHKISTCFKNAPVIDNNNNLQNIEILDEIVDDIIIVVTGTDGNFRSDQLNIIPEYIKHKKFSKDQIKIIATYINELLESVNEKSVEHINARNKDMMSLGNFLYKDTPIYEDEKDNQIICTIDQPNKRTLETFTDYPLQSHIDLMEKFGLVDTQNGIKISGNRGYFLTGFGVRLNNALISYALDFITKKGYTLMETPHFVNENIMSKITQLSDYSETLYKLEGYDKYLIATSEQPLTAYFENVTLNENELPIKYAGVSSCYRKEAGSHGRNARGIYRVHQFTKVEQFCVTKKEQSWQMFDMMINICKEFYDSLGISYRIINIVSGALNNAASMKYDLEAWFPGSNDYCELVSCTNCLDYFSNRINTNTGYGDDKTLVHMLNCTLCANTRTLCCLIETYQTKDGFDIPGILKPYLDREN